MNEVLLALVLVFYLSLLILYYRSSTPRKLLGTGNLWAITKDHASFLSYRQREKCWPELKQCEALIKELPTLRKRGQEYRDRCDVLCVDLSSRLAELSDEHAESLAEHVMLVFSFLSYAYLRSSEPELRVLPASLAKPWKTASRFLGRPMSLDYVATVLANCHAGEASDSESVQVYATFTGSPDERHFYALHARIERAAEPALRAMVRILDKSSYGASALADAMEQIAGAVRTAAQLLPHMKDGCDPTFFYSELRGLLAGFESPITLRGVAGTTSVIMHGASGAQSALLPCVDAFLGIGHHGQHELPEYALDRVEHMPVSHRAFLRQLRRSAPASREAIKALVANDSTSSPNTSDLLARRSLCLDALAAFRQAHLALVKSFIIRPAAKNPADPLCPSPTSTVTNMVVLPAEEVSSSFLTAPIIPVPVSLTNDDTMLEDVLKASITEKSLRGTGGSALACFLRGRLEDTRNA